MVDELKLTRQAADGVRAERLLDDPLIGEAFEGLQRQYFEAWRSSGSDQREARERLWMASSIVDKVRVHLETVVSDGKLAKAHLDEIRATPSAYSGADSRIRSL